MALHWDLKCYAIQVSCDTLILQMTFPKYLIFTIILHKNTALLELNVTFE